VTSIWPWVGFNLFVLAMLAVDLGLFNRKAHVIRLREAGIWSAVVIATALLFNVGVYRQMGSVAGLEFLTGYLIEFALSVDNLFVFVLIFSYFNVPAQHQHRVLFWGILGALVMRAAMIGAGALLLARFDWIIYLFGAFLLVTGIRMALHDEIHIEPDANPVLKLVRRFVTVTPTYHGQRFFVREPHPRTGVLRRVATPLFIVLILLETTDVIFAVDSIPAIFGVTRDPFIVYTSNVFAILGLRSLYFVLAGVIRQFHYLQVGLSIVLIWVGAKMLLDEVLHVPIAVSLAVVAIVLVGSVVASLLFPKRAAMHAPVILDPPHARDDTTEAPGET
jgi:tellurite resistance protein TerC